MAKPGTLAANASKAVAASKGARHGPSNKNVTTGAKRQPRPSGPTAPIKGSDKGGV